MVIVTSDIKTQNNYRIHFIFDEISLTKASEQQKQMCPIRLADRTGKDTRLKL